MTRISLKEAYDNRDVIAQIARLNDIVDDLPNPDLTNVVLKTGNQVIDGVKQFNDQVVLAGGMDLTGLGPTTINGDLEVNGDIIQTGAAYETHAEQVFSHNEYIVMRDGAVNSLPAGSYSGLQVKKYDGTNDCRLVVDNQGVARVGDINDEQPLATRDEDGDLTSGALVKWDGVNKKLITSSANVGDDSHPVKIVGGAPAAVDFVGLTKWSSTASGFTISHSSAVNISDARIHLDSAGAYLAVMSLQYRLASTPADIIVASGFTVAGTQYYVQNIYPSGATGLYRTSATMIFTTASAADVDPLVYRTPVSPGQNTSADTVVNVTIIRIG